MANFRDDLKKLTDQKLPYARVCVVRELHTDNKTVDVEPIDHDKFNSAVPYLPEFYYGIMYSPSASTAVLEPSKKSLLVVIFFDNESGFVVSMSNATSLKIKDDKSDSEMEITIVEDSDGNPQASFIFKTKGKVYTYPFANGLEYSGDGKNMIADFEDIHRRTLCGSLFTVDCDIQILPSVEGRVRIATQRENIVNTKAAATKTVDDTGSVANFGDTYSAILTIINETYEIVYHPTSELITNELKGKAVANNYFEYATAYNHLKPLISQTLTSLNEHKYSTPFANALSKFTTAALDNLRDFTKTAVPDAVSFEKFKTFKSEILKRTPDNTSISELLRDITQLTLLENDGFVFYINPLYDVYSFVTSIVQTNVNNRWTDADYAKIKDILDTAEKTFFDGSTTDENTTNIDEYINEEKAIIDSEIETVITLGDIIKDLKKTVADLNIAVKTLINTGATATVASFGAPGPVVFTGLAAFIRDVEAINSDLGTLEGDVDSLLY